MQSEEQSKQRCLEGFLRETLLFREVVIVGPQSCKLEIARSMVENDLMFQIVFIQICRWYYVNYQTTSYLFLQTKVSNSF